MSQRTRTMGVLVLGAILGVLLTVVAGAIISGSHVVYATPEHKSAFLKEYKPEAVIKQFQSPRWTSTSGVSEEAEAGEHATFKRMFDVRFAIRAEDRKALTALLSEQIVNALQSSGASMVGKTGDAAVGFRFRYVDGNTTGNISMMPVQQLDPKHLGGLYGNFSENDSLSRLEPDEIPVEFTVSIEEIWMTGR